MMLGLKKEIQRHERPSPLGYQTPDQTAPTGLSAWRLQMATSIFLRGLRGHVQVNMHTLSSLRDPGMKNRTRIRRRLAKHSGRSLLVKE